jgi:thiosulfate dehydrogenase
MQRIRLAVVFIIGIAASFNAEAQQKGHRAPSLRVPDERTIPDGPMGDSIRFGKKVLTQTQIYASAYVGNGLNCSNCHLNAGTKAFASPWVGLWGVFPEYRARNAQVNALQDRVNDCFERSMNGKPLSLDSDEMRGILSYVWWLSRDVPTGVAVRERGFTRIKAPRPPDPGRGRTLYLERCSACHGADGQGRAGPTGQYLFPALWGPKSFNIGAGMARLNTAAAFIKATMPLGQDNSLSDQDAFDIAAYFTRQPRPDFAAKARDWPKGDRPEDVPY